MARPLQIPKLVLAFGFFFLAVVPLVNIVAWLQTTALLARGTALVTPHTAVPLGFLVGSMVVGAGILRIKRWGWWAFAIYTPVLVLYDVYGFARHPSLYNGGALAQTVIVFGAIGYFMRRDVFAPYLAPVARGFREAERIDLTAPITVNGVARRTQDVSLTGCFILWKGCPHPIGHRLTVDLDIAGEHFERERAEIMRHTPDGVGVEFDRKATVARFRAAVAVVESAADEAGAAAKPKG